MKLDINILRWYDNKVHSKYPHLTKRESQLWNNFISQFGVRWNRVAYDVTVDSEIPDFRFKSKNINSNWDYLKSLKIDCLVETGNLLTIIEIKPVFDMKAIGQLFVYKSLLPVVYDVDNIIAVGILTESATDNLVSVCKSLDIALWIQDRQFLI